MRALSALLESKGIPVEELQTEEPVARVRRMEQEAECIAPERTVSASGTGHP